MASSPYINHFLQPDTLIPDPSNPQALNKYSYVYNNPILHNDPTGHCIDGVSTIVCIAIAGAIIGAALDYGSQVYDNYQANNGDLGSALTTNIDGWSIAKSAVAGSATAVGLAIAAPIVISIAGDALAGAGLATGSTALFSAGMSAYELSAATTAIVYGAGSLSSQLSNICSFEENTKVTTSDGEVSISTIEVGDYVLAWNEADGTLGFYEVTNTFSHADEVITELIIDGEWIETTPEHPFYTEEEGWLPASEIEIGMHIRQADGGYELVWLKWDVYKTQEMYNLTVDTAHTYFVGEGQWLVHNGCPKSNTLQPGPYAQRSIPARGPNRDWTNEEIQSMSVVCVCVCVCVVCVRVCVCV